MTYVYVAIERLWKGISTCINHSTRKKGDQFSSWKSSTIFTRYFLVYLFICRILILIYHLRTHVKWALQKYFYFFQHSLIKCDEWLINTGYRNLKSRKAIKTFLYLIIFFEAKDMGNADTSIFGCVKKYLSVFQFRPRQIRAQVTVSLSIQPLKRENTIYWLYYYT